MTVVRVQVLMCSATFIVFLLLSTTAVFCLNGCMCCIHLGVFPGADSGVVPLYVMMMVMMGHVVGA